MSRDWGTATYAERCDRRDELAMTGSMWSDEDACGADAVPCGVCDECVSEGCLDTGGSSA